MRVAAAIGALTLACATNSTTSADATESDTQSASSSSSDGDPPATTQAETTTLPADTSGGTSDADSTTASADETAADTEATTTGSPQGPECGDGVVDPLEECDDGNAVDDDGCTTDCIPTAAVVWTASVDGPDAMDDCLRDVAVGADDTIWVTGWTRTAATERDVWTGVLDPDGALTASHQYNHTDDDHDEGIKVVVDPSGDGFVAARVDSSVQGVNVRLFRIDPTGTEVWATSVFDPDASYDEPTGLALSGTGEVVFTARVLAGSGEEATLGRYTVDGVEVDVSIWSDPTYAQARFADLVRVGDVLWSAAVYATGPGSPHNRLVLPSFSLAGVPTGAIDIAPPIEIGGLEDRIHLAVGPAGELVVANYDAFSEGAPVVRIFDAAGTLGQAWLLEMPAPVVQVHDLGVDAAGAVVLVGEHSQQLWARKHEPDGTIVWDRTLATATNGSRIEAVTFANDGDVLLAGCLDDDFWVGRFAP